jgi:adenine-specific DNA-methyltransferase
MKQFSGTNLLPSICDYILWYAKDVSQVKYRQLFRAKLRGEEGATKYDQVQLPNGTRRSMTQAEKDESSLVAGRVFTLGGLTSQTGVDNTRFDLTVAGRVFRPHPSVWKTGFAGMQRLLKGDRVVPIKSSVRYQRFLDDFAAFPMTNTWLYIGGIQSRADPKIYVVQTSTTAVERCILMSTDPGDLVLDPTCGSGTTALVAEQWGRRWMTVDTSRVALALARARLMGARYPYYLLADSREGQLKEAEITRTAPSSQPVHDNIRLGFVYERVPHITLKSIANNAEIDVIWEKGRPDHVHRPDAVARQSYLRRRALPGRRKGEASGNLYRTGVRHGAAG